MARADPLDGGQRAGRRGAGPRGRRRHRVLLRRRCQGLRRAQHVAPPPAGRRRTVRPRSSSPIVAAGPPHPWRPALTAPVVARAGRRPDPVVGVVAPARGAPPVPADRRVRLRRRRCRRRAAVGCSCAPRCRRTVDVVGRDTPLGQLLAVGRRPGDHDPGRDRRPRLVRRPSPIAEPTTPPPTRVRTGVARAACSCPARSSCSPWCSGGSSCPSGSFLLARWFVAPAAAPAAASSAVDALRVSAAVTRGRRMRRSASPR